MAWGSHKPSAAGSTPALATKSILTDKTKRKTRFCGFFGIAQKHAGRDFIAIT